MKQGLERTDATDGVNAESCPQYTSPRVMTLLQTITWSPLRGELLLMNEYREVPVIGDVGRWWAYIHEHMQRVVHALYETDDMFSRDTQAVQWLREASLLLGVGVATGNARDRVITVLSMTFLTQIRHNFLSNPVFAHIIRLYYILQPGPVSVGQAIRITMVFANTSLEWVRVHFS